LIQVKQIWGANIARATVPTLISACPRTEAAKRMQQVIESMYDK